MNKERLFSLFAISVFVAACQPGRSTDPQTDIEYLNLPGVAESGLPFSSAVRAGNTLYLSGVIGVIPGTLEVPETMEEEARLAMEQIKDTLETFGSSLDRVVKCTVFLADETNRDTFNQVYMGYFDRLPARSGVTVKGLALGAKAEVECIALVN